MPLDLSNETLGFIGGGNMAEAILRGLLEAGLRPEDLLAAEPVAARRRELEERLGIGTSDRNQDAVAFAPLVVLAVKPNGLFGRAE